jgi:peptidoglycan/xylan/chitin deacetylase (PgdA/CDA1 family)
VKAILTYHSVDNTGSVLSIDPAVFRGQIEWLARSGPAVVNVDQLLTLPPTASAVAITFDDAFANFADVAWPVLRDHSLPVTQYVATDYAGKRNAWSASDRSIPQLPLLDWNGLARLVEEGVTLGSHTCTHPHLPTLGSAQLREELERSGEQLERMTGVRPSGLAYPYGSHDARTVSAAAAMYEHACTAELRILHESEDAHRLPRLDVYYLRQPGTLEGWGTPRLKLYLRARASARRCRELLSLATRR